MRVLRLSLASVVFFALAGCPSSGDPGPILDGAVARDAARRDGATTAPGTDAAVARREPIEVPSGRWIRWLEDTRATAWETRIVYDPLAHRIVQHGGHVPGSYVQSNGTTLLDLRERRIDDALADPRPQRRCIVGLAWIGSLGETFTVNGGADHGSLPVGALAEDGTRIRRNDAAGPWLYDARRDRWEDTRPPTSGWTRSTHTPVAYDPGSDAVFSLTGRKLVVYSVHRNATRTRDLPEALWGRRAYGFAVDPVRRLLVVFGGTGPLQWTWASDREAAYAEYVRQDTWIYDIGADTWRELEITSPPPRGEPMVSFVELPLIHHTPSGTLVLLQTPADEPLSRLEDFPPSRLYQLDLDAERWEEIPIDDPLAVPGIMTYSEEEDLLVHYRGGVVHVARPELGHGAPRFAPELALHAASDTRGVALSWVPTPGTRYVVERAVDDLIPGAFSRIGEVVGGNFRDDGVDDVAYAYRVRAEGGDVSGVAFSTPLRPRFARASVESSAEVVLRWDPVEGAVGYHVYRATGTRSGSRVTESPITEARFVDHAPGLDDGIIRRYWVRAVDAAGHESGPSNAALTAPDPVASLSAEARGDGELVVRFSPPASSSVEGVQLWMIDQHVNTLGMSDADREAFWSRWTLITPTPTSTGEVVVPITPDREHPHRYFYARAVNRLGQLGFYSDIVSATDPRFRVPTP